MPITTNNPDIFLAEYYIKLNTLFYLFRGGGAEGKRESQEGSTPSSELDAERRSISQP